MPERRLAFGMGGVIKEAIQQDPGSVRGPFHILPYSLKSPGDEQEKDCDLEKDYQRGTVIHGAQAGYEPETHGYPERGTALNDGDQRHHAESNTHLQGSKREECSQGGGYPPTMA